jgi:hypothetical protein
MRQQGRSAYESYAARGEVSLSWETLTEQEQAAWHAAAEAAIREFCGEDDCPETVRAPHGYPEGVL